MRISDWSSDVCSSDLPFGLKIGYGATYQGKFTFNLPTATADPELFQSDDYWVHNAYLAYDFTDRISAQLNIKNFTDKLYFTRIRNNGWATPGDARSEEHTSELQSLMRISYAVFCLKKKKKNNKLQHETKHNMI